MITEARERLRYALSRSTSFQELTGTVSHPEFALERVHVDAVSPDPKNGENYTLEELLGIRPYALVYYGDEAFQWVRDAMGEGPCSGQQAGMLMCELYRNTPEGSAQDVAISFMDLMGGIAEDVIGMSEQPEALFIRRFTFNGPYRTSEEEYADLGDSQGALMTFTFGNIDV